MACDEPSTKRERVVAACCITTPTSCFDAFKCVGSTLAFAPMTIPELRAASSSAACLPSAMCCTVPMCQRLRIVVIRACPWDVVPGSSIDPGTCGQQTTPNQPWPKCQQAVTSGLAFKVNLAGTPSAVPLPYDPPAAIQAAYPTVPPSAMSMFEFDFGLGCSREASGKMLAMGLDGAASASLSFTYTWCGAKCKGVAIPTSFTVTGCTYTNVRFDVLPSFLSTDPCAPSYVVLQIRQYCYEDAEGGCAPAPCCLEVPGGGPPLCPDGPAPCRAGALNCLDKTTMRKTLTWSGLGKQSGYRRGGRRRE